MSLSQKINTTLRENLNESRRLSNIHDYNKKDSDPNFRDVKITKTIEKIGQSFRHRDFNQDKAFQGDEDRQEQKEAKENKESKDIKDNKDNKDISETQNEKRDGGQNSF